MTASERSAAYSLGKAGCRTVAPIGDFFIEEMTALGIPELFVSGETRLPDSIQRSNKVRGSTEVVP